MRPWPSLLCGAIACTARRVPAPGVPLAGLASMTLNIRAARRAALLARLLSRRRSGPDDLIAGPLRGELLGADRLAQRARAVARGQRVVAAAGRRRPTAALLVRLDDTRGILDDVHERLSATDRELDIG